MPKFLSPDQEAQFKQQLEQEDAPDDASSDLSPEQQQQAMEQGAQMAAADAGAGAEGQPAAQPGAGAPAPQADPNASKLAELGFESVDQLAEAFTAASKGQSELKELLTKLVAVKKAEGDAAALNPNDPNYAVNKAVRDQLAPIREKMERDARNRIVQDSWKKSAAGKTDLDALMPEISAYIGEHPDLATSDDGLDRAYDAVRSKRYRPEGDLLNDPEFVRRMAENEKVKKAVLEKHLQGVARSGDVVPPSISSGGGTPLTPAKQAPNRMDNAKQQLKALLEQDERMKKS